MNSGLKQIQKHATRKQSFKRTTHHKKQPRLPKKSREIEFIKTSLRFVGNVPCNEIRNERNLEHRDWNGSKVVKELIALRSNRLCKPKKKKQCHEQYQCSTSFFSYFRQIQIPKDLQCNISNLHELDPYSLKESSFMETLRIISSPF